MTSKSVLCTWTLACFKITQSFKNQVPQGFSCCLDLENDEIKVYLFLEFQTKLKNPISFWSSSYQILVLWQIVKQTDYVRLRRNFLKGCTFPCFSNRVIWICQKLKIQKLSPKILASLKSYIAICFCFVA